MVQVKRREKESVNGLIRRFVRTVQQSGVLWQARRSRFYEKKKSRRELKEKALHREKVIAEQERLRKLGILEDEAPRKSRPRR